MTYGYLRGGELTLGQKLVEFNWMLLLFVSLIACVGFAMLYSAADGSFEPWALRQMIRFAFGIVVMLVVALVDIRIWLQLAYPVYFITLSLLLAVEYIGLVGGGAQRWVNLGLFQIQPSEVMKISLVLALAHYFHGCNLDDVERKSTLIVPLLLVAAPAALVLRQPDLGTALLLIAASAAIFFLAGVRTRFFVISFGLGVAIIPVAWQFLRDYQKDRIIAFFNPEADPLGKGYHIIQSKIALGSGGLFGKGFMSQATLSHLDFLPEKRTDFIFTMLAEEFGMVGCLGLLTLYMLVIGYGVGIGLQSRNQYGRLVALGITTTFFLYVFINIGMVMGLLPVVGVPLPFVSYGGTAMMTLLIAMGLVANTYIHRDTVIPRKYAGND